MEFHHPRLRTAAGDDVIQRESAAALPEANGLYVGLASAKRARVSAPGMRWHGQPSWSKELRRL